MASKKGPPPVVYVVLGIILIVGGYQLLPTIIDIFQDDNQELRERFSDGDKELVEPSVKNPAFVQSKQRGLQAMAAENYSQAVQDFEAALQEKRNSPETLIYLNNARIGEEQAFEVAVTVPLGTDTQLFALELLRGYAQAQQEINQAGGVNGTPIKLTLVDEDDDPEIAEQVATELAQRNYILAVTGHWSSSTTLAVAPIYDNNELVLVNPVSTSTEISGISNYVFRTIPSNFIVGATMANYALENLQVQQLAIFYDSNSGYSLSLRKELKTSLSTRGGSIVAEFDLSQPGFIAQQRLDDARNRGAEAIALIPAPETIDRALQVVTVNNQNLPLLGDIGNLYGIKTLQVGEDAVGMAIPIPWHIQQPGNQAFVAKSRELWGGDVNWATVMAYDAMSAIAQALAQDPTRRGIQNTLSSNNFSAPGVVQPVQFLPSGDRDGQLIMVEVQPTNPSRSGTGYDFVPLQ
ncbi:MAG: ABC transporter substrate-binding protein [Cyanobacteria bacterium]|jgi:branched-chain amino acid transport system substrate-binding protein|nr:ABC transporter substrate-binding protein [Cyanobacteria bacterium GSL.Bin21]